MQKRGDTKTEQEGTAAGQRQTAEGQRHRAVYLSTMWQPLTREAAGCAVCAVITEGVVGDDSSMI